MDRIVGGRFKLKKKIGAGSFGEIFIGENTCTHRRVAVKLEKSRCRCPQLSFEAKLYKHMQGGTGVPTLHYFGSDSMYNIMVIDLLGKSLEDLFVQCRRKFTLKTVLMLADQMLSCVEFFHSKNFIHRDIKPDNFVMGVGQSANQVFIIDYGLAKKYRDSNTHQHIPYTDGKSLTGTARYASVGALRGCEQSRRDDLEALGYVWMYLLRGSLPWMGINGANRKQKYDRICDVKAKTTPEELCKGFPQEFVKYFHIVKNLQFTEMPDYSTLRKMFRDLFEREGFVYDYRYDWTRGSRPTTSRTPNRNEALSSAEVKEKARPLTTNVSRKDPVLEKARQKPSVINKSKLRAINPNNNKAKKYSPLNPYNKTKREIIQPIFDNKRLLPRWIREPQQNSNFRKVVIT